MISPDGSKAFICDFGITTFARTYAREYYTWHDNSERWDAPELMEPDLACPSPIKPSFASDVYSFALSCVEVNAALSCLLFYLTQLVTDLLW